LIQLQCPFHPRRADLGATTKPQMALEQIRGALKAGVARGVLLMDASYGTNSPLRLAITDLGLCYVAAIISTVKVRRGAAAGSGAPRGR
jgi:SRSO17 transposase